MNVIADPSYGASNCMMHVVVMCRCFAVIDRHWHPWQLQKLPKGACGLWPSLDDQHQNDELVN